MSVYVTSWVLKYSETRMGDRLVLLSIADYANDDGHGAYAKVDKYASAARLSIRQAKRCLKNLRDAGAIEQTGVHKWETGQTTPIYRVVMQTERGDNLSPLENERGDIYDTKGVTYGASSPITTHQLNHQGGSSSKSKTKAVETASQSGAAKPKKNPAREVFDYWQAVMASPRSMATPDRLRKIEARLKEGATVADCKRAIDGCAGSDFHMGRDPANDLKNGGRKHNSVGLIFRNREKLEDFMELAPEVKAPSVDYILETRSVIHEVEAEDLRAEGKFPFDAASEAALKEAGRA